MPHQIVPIPLEVAVMVHPTPIKILLSLINLIEDGGMAKETQANVMHGLYVRSTINWVTLSFILTQLKA